LPTKVLQAGRNILAEACSRRSASGHLGVTRVDRAALFDALCRRDARLREQVDLDALEAELLTVVDQTMAPTKASLWLRPPAIPPLAR
jgi:hypothetical protein